METNQLNARKIVVGMGYIFSGLDRLALIDYWGKDGAILESHPFGMDIHERATERIIIVAPVGTPGTSYNKMTAHIRCAIGGKSDEEATPYKLRVISCANNRKGDQNYLFFEIQTWLGTFICGGCTDFSGAGGHATEIMEGVFALLSLVYEVAIERKSISLPESAKMRKALDRSYSEYRRKNR